MAHCLKSLVGELLRVAWCTVGGIVGRVVADIRAMLFEAVRVGSGVLLWARPGA